MTPERVEPGHLWIPEGAVLGDDSAADLMAVGGVELFEWQREVLRIALATRPDGLWAARDLGLVVPRQNGKSWALAALAIHGLFVDRLPVQLWTAHEYTTALETYGIIESIINASPHLRRRVKGMYHSNGNTKIEMLALPEEKRGPRLIFKARTPRAGRGLTVDRLILDEAMQLSGDAMATLRPTQSACPNPQIVYAASAGLIDTDHLRKVRDRGRRGGDPKLAWIEYCSTLECPPECSHDLASTSCALNDRREWRKANPSMGLGGLTEDDALGERLDMDWWDFARERLGVWSDVVGEAEVDRPFTLEEWAARGGRELPDERGRVWLAVDVGPGSQWASLAAGIAVDGGVQVSLVERRPGTAWVAEAADDMASRWDAEELLIDGVGAAAGLIPVLREQVDCPVHVLTTREVIEACSRLQLAVAEGTVQHSSDPIVDAAVESARRRQIGDTGWGWRRSDSEGDITPLVAITWAHWAVARDPDAVADVSALPEDEDDAVDAIIAGRGPRSRLVEFA